MLMLRNDDAIGGIVLYRMTHLGINSPTRTMVCCDKTLNGSVCNKHSRSHDIRVAIFLYRIDYFAKVKILYFIDYG